MNKTTTYRVRCRLSTDSRNIELQWFITTITIVFYEHIHPLDISVYETQNTKRKCTAVKTLDHNQHAQTTNTLNSCFP